MSSSTAALGSSPLEYSAPDDRATLNDEPVRSDLDVRASKLFLHIGFLTCLVLQRFGYLSGTMALFLSTPVFLGLLAWMLMTGRARIRTEILMPFMGFIAMAALATAVALAFPDNRVSISLTSPLAIVMNYMVFMVAPSARFDKRPALDIFVFYARFISIAGILQYAVQFVGISIFSWMVSFPPMAPFLVEDAYNNLPTTSWRSSTMRSNGFFMLEPSIFSQMLVIAICVEFFLYKRWKFLPVYALAYAVSYSGTGLLCLLIALPVYVALFYKEAGRVIWFGVAALAVAGAAYVALPDVVGQLAGRSSEFESSGSSGYKRYIGQFESVDVVLNEARLLVGFGPGATDRASFYVEGSGGTMQKLLIDYGLFGFIAFFAFLIPAIWRRDLAIVPLLSLSVFLFGGGKLFAAYAIMLTALLCIWTARPIPDGEPTPA
jgi:hypothetical protein